MAVEIASQVLRKHARAVSAAADYDDLEIGPVPPGQEWHITHVASVDETTAITKRGWAIKSAGFLYWIEELLVTTADLHDGDKVNVTLAAGESLICRLTGCTLNDILYAYATGTYRLVPG